MSSLLTVFMMRGQALHAQFDAALEPRDLSLAKMWALRCLDNAAEPVPLGTLAEQLDCAKSNVTQLIDRLETQGLVQRVRSREDRRSVCAVLTPTGQAQYQQGLAIMAQLEAAFLGRYSREEQHHFRALLERLE